MDPFKNKWVTVGLCGYEILAILSKEATGKDTIPTVTRLCSHHKWLGVALTGAMGWHFVSATIGAAR
jgi:hypothetical protein